MKVLHVNWHDSVGGAAIIAQSIVDGLRDRGHTAHFAVAHRQNPHPDNIAIPDSRTGSMWYQTWNALEKQLRNRGVRGAFVPHQMSKLVPISHVIDRFRGREDFNHKGSRQVLELVPDRPDVLHLHNLHVDYFDLRRLPILSRQLPIVATLHDTWMLSGHCAYSLECTRWTTGCGRCPHLETYPSVLRDATAYNWRRKRSIYANSKLSVVTPSQWLLDCVGRSILAPAVRNATVIHNGVDLTTFHAGSKTASRAALGWSQDAFIALFVANGIRSNTWKDYETMAAAVRQVGANALEREVHFICVGEAGTSGTNGSTTIHFVDYEKDPSVVAKFYRAADVYLHAAKADTFPTTVLEALACGTPVVATAVGGIPEQIDDGVTGYLIPPGDSQLMAAQISNLCINPELQSWLGSNAAADAASRFGADRMVDNYLAYYANVLDDAARV